MPSVLGVVLAIFAISCCRTPQEELVSLPVSPAMPKTSPHTATVKHEGAAVGLSGYTVDLSLMVQDGLYMFQVSSSEELEQILILADGAGEFPEVIVNIAPLRLPVDLDSLTVRERKELFIRSIMPIVLAENHRIRVERDELMSLKLQLKREARLELSGKSTLKRLAERYNLTAKYPLTNPTQANELINILQKRVDIVPPSLVIAQAAIESGWGTSRFALEGNSLFGQWVFGSQSGIVPSERPSGAAYRVASFNTLAESIREYLNNLNTGWAYASFRKSRSEQRLGSHLDSLALAEELIHYSTRGELYIEELKSIIAGNRLQEYDHSHLCALPHSEASLLALRFEAPSRNHERAN